MDDLTGFWKNGPTQGVIATLVAACLAVLYVAWKAVPVYREWVKAVLEMRVARAATDARIEALSRQMARQDQTIAVATDAALLAARASAAASPDDHLKARVASLADDIAAFRNFPGPGA